MNLSELFENKAKRPEAYWSLVLEKNWVQSGVWSIVGGKAEIMAASSPSPWEAEEDLIGACDASLSSCMQKLPEDFPEPQKTVFGVASSWVKGGDIKEEYLSQIKKICTDLSLTPSGFVVLPEAIAHLYKSEEGTPLNAIVIGLSGENIDLSIFSTGNLVGTTQVARSVSLAGDVVEGIARLDRGNALPARIIIFDGKGGELEDAKASLSEFSWDEAENLKFLHTPKIEIFESDKKVLATSLAGASEIAGVSQVKQSEIENISEVDEERITPQSLGFTVDGGNVGVSEAPEARAPVQYQNAEPIPVTPPRPPKIEIGKYMDKTRGIFHNLAQRFQKPPGKGSKMPFIALGIGIVVLALLWWFIPKATVSIYVSPKKFEEEFEVGFNSSNARIEEVEVSGEKTKSATGSRLVGERAKGAVRIQNGTAFPINLTAGTIIVSSGDLRFSLDKTASVSGAISPSSPGTASVDVTADAIGAEYNLAKDESFKVGNYPKAEVDATATANFGGGSSREISAVSEEDQKKLLEDLTGELNSQAKSQLASKIDANQIFINDLVSAETSQKSFDHKVGDEAENVKLTMTLAGKGVLVDRTKIADMVRERLKDKTPSGFVLRDSQIDYEFAFIEEDGGEYKFNVKAKANFLPEIKDEEIVAKIAGKFTDVVEKYLSTIPGYVNAEVRIKPNLPGFFGTLPRVRKNITIEIVSQ